MAPESLIKIAKFERAKPPKPFPREGYDKHLVPEFVDLDLSRFGRPEDLFDVGPEKEPATGPTPCFSPVVYLPGKGRAYAKDALGRKIVEPRVESVTAVVLDYDEATEADFDRVVEGLITRGLEFACHHSYSHATAKKPFAARIIVPLAEPIPVVNDSWAPTWERAVRDLGADVPGLDRKCSDAVRLFYLPRKPAPDSPHTSAYVPGKRYAIPGTAAATVPAVVPVAVRAVVPAPAVTVKELRETLTRCPSKEAQRLGRGEAVSPPPGKRAPGDLPRKQAWHAATGALARIAPLGTPLRVLEEVCTESWWKEQQESPEDYTPLDAITKSLSHNVSITEPRKEAERRGLEALNARMKQATEAAAADGDPQPDPEDLPVIRVDGHVSETLITDTIVAALAVSPRVYSRGGELVLVGGAIHPVTRYSLIDEISRRCRLVTVPKNGEEARPARCSERTAAIIMSLREWPAVREIVEVRRCSFLSQSGRVVDAKGYDIETRCVLRPTVEHEPVPEAPTREQASGGLRALEALVGDFPFESPAHLSGWLALVLTLVARPALKQVPLFMIDAAASGSGKTLLVDLAAVIAAGTGATRSAWSGNVDEQRKAVLAVLRDAVPLCLIDNLPNGGNLGSHVLDNLLSSEVYSDRVLGQSATLTLPARTVWCATGNNLSVAGDMQRRVVPVRLASPVDDPSARVGFRLPRILEAVFEQRGALLRGALTALRGYFAAGRPPMPPSWRPWGHPFDGWSDLIRGTLAWLGADDPADARKDVQTSAESGSETLAEVLGLLGGTDEWRSTKDLLTGQLGRALQGVLAEKSGEELSSKAVGKRLVAMRQRVCGGKRLVSKKDKTTDMLLWRVEKVAP